MPVYNLQNHSHGTSFCPTKLTLNRTLTLISLKVLLSGSKINQNYIYFWSFPQIKRKSKGIVNRLTGNPKTTTCFPWKHIKGGKKIKWIANIERNRPIREREGWGRRRLGRYPWEGWWRTWKRRPRPSYETSGGRRRARRRRCRTPRRPPRRPAGGPSPPQTAAPPIASNSPTPMPCLLLPFSR